MTAARLLSRRFDEALRKLLLAIGDDPSCPEPLHMAACLPVTGRLERCGSPMRIGGATPGGAGLAE